MKNKSDNPVGLGKDKNSDRNSEKKSKADSGFADAKKRQTNQNEKSGDLDPVRRDLERKIEIDDDPHETERKIPHMN